MRLDPVTFVLTSSVALVTWVAWAMLAFQIGTRLLPGPETSATLGQLLRTTGFAAAPGLLQVFALLPAMAVPVFSVTTAWMFAAMVVGVRHTLDYRSLDRRFLSAGWQPGSAFQWRWSRASCLDRPSGDRSHLMDLSTNVPRRANRSLTQLTRGGTHPDRNAFK